MPDDQDAVDIQVLVLDVLQHRQNLRRVQPLFFRG